MLIERKGSIFDSTAQAIVNPVNCVGAMGKGLALEFKKRFPQNFQAYKFMCAERLLKTGQVFAHYDTVGGKLIINFPTKDHWKNASKLSFIQDGLRNLSTHAEYGQFESIALPLLGCGLGGLHVEDVRPLIEGFAAKHPEINVELWTN